MVAERKKRDFYSKNVSLSLKVAIELISFRLNLVTYDIASYHTNLAPQKLTACLLAQYFLMENSRCSTASSVDYGAGTCLLATIENKCTQQHLC